MAAAPADPCAFCLEPLGPNTLALPCGHAYHSTCAVQFLLSRAACSFGLLGAERKQCPCCRASVDESRVVDVSQLPDASGRQFVQPSDASSAAAALPDQPQQRQKQALNSDAKQKGSSTGQIELRAYAGTPAWLASGSGSIGAGPRRTSDGMERLSGLPLLPLTSIDLAGGFSRRETSTTQPFVAEGSAAAPWLPDIFPIPSRSPSPHISLTVDGARSPSILQEASQSAAAATAGGPEEAIDQATAGVAAAAAAAAATTAAADQAPQQPLRTIRVVRRRTCLRPVLVFLLLALLVAIVVITPIVFSNMKTRDSSSSSASREAWRVRCLACFLDGSYCPECPDPMDWGHR